MRWNCIPLPKFQQCSHWSWEIDKWFLPTLYSAGAHFTNNLLLIIQIQWKIWLAVTLFFLHMTRQHSWRALHKICSDNCIKIEVKLKRNFHQISIAMENLLVKLGSGDYISLMVLQVIPSHVSPLHFAKPLTHKICFRHDSITLKIDRQLGISRFKTPAKL